MNPEVRRYLKELVKSSVLSTIVLAGVACDQEVNNSGSSTPISSSGQKDIPHVEVVEFPHKPTIEQPSDYELEEGVALVIQEERIKKIESYNKSQEHMANAAQEAARLYTERQAILRAVPKANLQSPTLLSSGVALITGYYCKYDSGVFGDGGGYCGPMANGEIVHEGAAACGSNWTMGTTIYIDSLPKTVVCKDRGLLAPNQIDVFSEFSSGLINTQTSSVTVIEG